MNSIDRLIRRIGAVLNGEAEGFEARALASNYAALVESTRERLHQCAALIRAHNEHTALQIAESDPPVLDLAAKLAFADSGKWRAWCKSAGMPSPSPIEDHLIELVNSLYSKAIDQTHPLYKEYRAAVREHDDLRALTVLRSITRVNVKDANAREEYDRLAAKVRRELLAQMREAFIHHRNEEAFGYMSKLEVSGLGPFDDNADWRDAAKARDDWERRKMQGEALMTLPELLKLKSAGEWEACIPLLAKARTLRQQYGFHIHEDDEKQFAHLESWVMGHSAVAEKVRLERELIDSLLSRIEGLTKRFETPPTSGAEATARLAEIDDWLAAATAAPDTVHIGTAIHRARDLRDSTAALRSAFGRRKRIAITTATVGTLVLGSIAGYLINEAVRTKAFADALAAVESESSIQPVRAFLAGPARENPAYAAKPDYKPRIAALEAKSKSADRELAEIIRDAGDITAAAQKADADTAKLAARLPALEKRLAALPTDMRGEARNDITRARDAVEQRRAEKHGRLTAGVATAAAALETLLTTPESDASLAGWSAASAKLTAALASPGLPDSDIVTAAKETLARARTVFPVAAAKVTLQRALGEAATLDAHLSAIAAAAKTPVDSPETQSFRRVHDAARDLRKLPLAILPPATAALAPYATPGTRFIGGDTAAMEASDAAGLVAECAKQSDIWRLTLSRTAADGTGGTIVIFFKGRPEIVTYSLSSGEETRTKGTRLKPDGTTEAVSYTYRRFEGRPGIGDQPGVPSRAAESDLYIAGAKLFDSDRGVFTDSLLAQIDRLYAAKFASPIMRARMLLQLYAILEARPQARGLDFVPELRDELAALRKICGTIPPEGSWLTPERYGDIQPGLARHFETKHPAYAALADFRAKLIRACLDSGCTYVGACDATGAPVLRKPVPAKGTRLLALDEAGKPAVIGVMGDAGAITSPHPACAYSPILVLAKSPAEIAESIATPVRPAAPEGDWTNLILTAP